MDDLAKKIAEVNADGLSVGERLKKVRAGRSQEVFAKLLGISSKTLMRYESNERMPDMELVLRLNFSFNVQPIWLLTGAHEPLFGGMNPEEQYLVNTYRDLDDATRKAVSTIFNRLAELHFIAKTATPKKAAR